MVRVFTLPIIRLQHIIGDEVNLLTMATHGKIATFNSTVESWTSYCERLHFYFDANDIVDPGKKRSILLTVCGPSTYQLLKNLVQPRTPMDKTYDEIVETLKPTLTLNRHLLSRDSSSTRETVVPENHWQTMLLNLECSENTAILGQPLRI